MYDAHNQQYHFTGVRCLGHHPERPDRIESRVLKRRRHGYPLMQEPRQVLRDRLLAGNAKD